MSVLKLVINKNLIDTERLMEIISDLLPESFEQTYFENLTIDELTNTLLKVTVGDDWGLDDDEVYRLEFKITNDGNLIYIGKL